MVNDGDRATAGEVEAKKSTTDTAEATELLARSAETGPPLKLAATSSKSDARGGGRT